MSSIEKEEPISYNYLMKRAIKFSIEVIIVLILVFYWEVIFKLIRLLYNF